ncbi:HpcH/HpaI aldolase/citrate lyase family protein [Roseicyclus mahoneyensis]|uniref:(3S)-malyl-CoA thioesterase n=1 Tax=Roseicyclus mahoneyensis TaxID=164332 RepID=A0A316GED9_9RHOB|nr:CoA ester lyase [Roseicyclus mahoneyensis]PWK59314.1 (3S)-malyl-CoA thioesterase [Roseicyclus mahoneyensis]
MDTLEIRARPYRSVLYIPASKDRAIEKAKGLAADAIIFDLEDAVAVEEKAHARDLLTARLTEGGFGNRALMVRINGLDTPWGEDDLSAVMAIGPQAILLPKVGSVTEVAALAARLHGAAATRNTQIWAMMETPMGILNAAEIARAPRMTGFVMGTNDLAKELGCRTRGAMHMALQHCLLAARAAGILCIDGVYNAFRDEEGLAVECAEGRDFGFDGKTLIHPSQIAIANTAFAPSQAEIDLARRQIAAFEAATAQGQAVAVVDGQIVENLHVDTARATLAKADAIARQEAA